ncbi:hypothetical protein KM043_008892 [Ampulex compressa]|nr:hypothetical protein KM043_008892 [Ampulex compressa]
MKLLSVIIPLALCIVGSEGYRILGVFPFHGKSHFIMFEQLMKGLARKGHAVDVISPFPLKKSYANYTDLIALPPPRQFVNNLTYMEMQKIISVLPVHAVATLAGNDLCKFLGHPEVQNLIRHPPQDPPYDLMIMEIFGAHCFGIIGHLFKIPIVGVSSSILYPWAHDIIANPDNLAYVPNNVLSMSRDMNFWDRLYNTVHTVFNKMYFNHLTRAQDKDIENFIGPGMPSVRDLEQSVALVLTNSHISLTGIQPMTPALIEIGGLHVQDDGAQLDPSLEKWLNDSKDGFVYFTFGSMVTIESFPRAHLDVFYKSLGKIAPIRVLMKVPNPQKLPPGLPANILTSPWISQLKVLKHPNVKAFITHGGLMGTQEAVHCGVPMVGIPLFADQFINIDNYVAKNIAVKLDIENLTEEKMDAALNEILHNPIYRNTMKRISARFTDRPVSAMDTAIYWIEYIGRYGSEALRSPAMDLSWWQVQLLDVYGFLLLAGLLLVLVATTLLRFLIDALRRLTEDSQKKKNA